MKSVRHQNREAFGPYCIPRRNRDATKIEPLHNEEFLGSSVTDNAISVQAMRLLQLDLELSVQCSMRPSAKDVAL
jgi:hypothetical protein